MKRQLSVFKLIALFWVYFLFSGTSLAEEKVTLATTNWAPYYAQSLPNGGPLAEVTRVAFKRVGYDVEVSWLPWKRALSKVDQGDFSAVLGAYKNPQRAELFHFSEEPLAYTESGVFSVDQVVEEYTQLTDLKDVSICTLRGTSISPEFDQADYLKTHISNSEEGCIKLLLRKRVDAIAGSRFVFNALLKKHNDQLKLKPIVILDRRPLFHAFSKKKANYQTVQADFDKGLRLIKQDKTYDQVMTKHGFYVD